MARFFSPGRRWPWILLAVVLGALSLIWATAWRESRVFAAERLERYGNERRVVADLVAENLLRQLQRLDDVLLQLRREYLENRAALPATIALLRHSSLQDLGARVTVIDREGYVAATDAPLQSGERIYLGDRQHFLHFAQGAPDSLFIGGPVMGRMTKRPGLQIARPILDRQGRFAGVVVFFMEPRQLTAFVQHLDLGPDGVLTLASANGTILGRSRAPEDQLGKQMSEQQFQPFRDARQGMFTRLSVLDGVKRTLVFRWLDRYPLLVMVAASPQEVDGEIAARQAANVRQAALLSFLVLLLGGAFAYHQVRRDRLEALLARERSHLLDAQRVARVGSWERDFRHGHLWWSDEVYRLLGYTPSLQAPSLAAFLAVVHPQERERVKAAIIQAREQGTFLDEACRLALPGNVERFVQIGGRMERDETGQPLRFTGTLQDVTDTHRLQQALQDAEERWKFALDGAGDGVWDWQVAENRTYFSPRWKEILGYGDDELPNRYEEWLNRLHPDDKALALAAMTDHFAGRQPVYQQEFRLCHKDGRYRWVFCRGKVCLRDEAGRPLRMLGTLADISERKEADLALARSEAMQRSLVSAMAEGVVVQDQTGKILSANAAARRILRLREEVLLGRDSNDPHWQAVREDGTPFPGDEHPSMVTLRTGISCDNVIMGLRFPDAATVWLSVNSRPLSYGEQPTPSAVVTSFADITEIKAAELSNRIYRDVLERVGRAILITDAEGRIDNVNSAFVALLGYSREECVGRKAGFFRTKRHDADFFRQMWHALKTQGEWHGEIWDRRKTGESILLDLDIRAVNDAKGQVEQYVGIYQDVTELRRSQEEMWRQAHHDPLTGLPNRVLFLDRLDQALNQARRQGCRLGLLYIDLDGFKAINDTYGHQAGDALLQAVAQRLEGVVRASDTVARLAGDEFAVLLPSLSMEDDLQGIAAKIEVQVTRPLSWQGRNLHVGVSVGGAVFPDQAEVREHLIGCADAAMYRAKQQHRAGLLALPSPQ